MQLGKKIDTTTLSSRGEMVRFKKQHFDIKIWCDFTPLVDAINSTKCSVEELSDSWQYHFYYDKWERKALKEMNE